VVCMVVPNVTPVVAPRAHSRRRAFSAAGARRAGPLRSAVACVRTAPELSGAGVTRY
jgi:hypothetical protein